MATAKKGFGLPCPPPEDDNMGYIDMRSKSGLCPIRQGYTISCNPKVDDMGYIDMRTKSRAKPH